MPSDNSHIDNSHTEVIYRRKKMEGRDLASRGRIKTDDLLQVSSCHSISITCITKSILSGIRSLHAGDAGLPLLLNGEQLKQFASRLIDPPLIGTQYLSVSFIFFLKLFFLPEGLADYWKLVLSSTARKEDNGFYQFPEWAYWHDGSTPE